MVNHSLIVIVKILNDYDSISSRINSNLLKMSLLYLTMMTYIWVIIACGWMVYQEPNPAAKGINITTSSVMLWFQIEIMAFFGCLFSNVCFLFLRTIFSVKIDIPAKYVEKSKLSRIDTMVALHNVS